MCAWTEDTIYFMKIFEQPYMLLDGLNLSYIVCQYEFIDFADQLEIFPSTIIMKGIWTIKLAGKQTIR